MRRLRSRTAFVSVVAVVGTLTGVLSGVVARTPAYAGSQFLPAPTYSGTLVGAGQASMYPVDVTNDSQYYFLLDAGNYRLLAVNRSTHTIDWTFGGMQGNGPGQFGDARAIDYDSANGEIFVADTPNNRVEVFSFSATSGFAYLAQFGSKGTGDGQFTQAYGVAVDPVHSWVYVTDGAGRVEKFQINANNTFTYLSQFGGSILNQPRQVAVAPNGDVFVMNARNHTCDVFNSAGSLLTSFGSQGTGNGQFTDDPRGVAISAEGTTAFVTDSGGKRIEAFTLTQTGGHYSNAAWSYTIPSGTGSGKFVGPRGLSTTSDNHLLLTDEWGFNYHEFSFTPGTISYTSTFDATGVPAPVPGVNAPRGLRVAPNGQIYIVDYWNQRIEYMKTDGSGAQTFGFRGNPSQPGAINFAWDAAIQPGTGDVFVANRENHQIAVFGPTGTTLAIWGQRGTANGQFTFPQGIAFAPDGTLYVDDSGNGRVQRFSIGSNSVGTWLATYGQHGTGSSSPAGDLNMPTGIAVASDGTLWVADTLNNRVQKMSTSGKWTAFHVPAGSKTAFHVPWGVTVAPDGSVWVSDTGHNRIVSMDTSGNLVFAATGTTMGVPGNQTIFPFAVAFDSSGFAYLSDIWNNRVLKLSSSNGPAAAPVTATLARATLTQTTLTPSYVRTLGGPGHAGMYPSGMEIAPNGNVVVADTGNNQIAEYTPAGTQLWRVGSEGNAAPCGANPTGFPQFEQPRDVGVDSAGNVYVADNGNGRVLKLSGTTGKCLLKPFKLPGGAPIGVTVSTTPAGQRVLVANGTKSQVAVFDTSGNLVQTISSQGACTINRARDAAADASGNISVANYESNNILEFNSSGNCLRSWGTKGSGNGQFKNPYGVAIGTDPYINGGKPGEAIYVADSNNDRIQEFTPTGTFVATMGSPGPNTQPGTFTQLRRVAVDANGNIWGADLWGNRVEQFTRSSSGYTYASTIPNPVVPPGNTDTSVYNQVRGISFDSAGDVVSMDTVNQRVVVMNSTGHILALCGQRGFTSAGSFNWPRGVAVDPVSGNYWVADTKQSDLQIIGSETGSQPCAGLAKFATVGAGLGQDNYPYSIAIAGGYAWIADTKNNRVESWTVATHNAVSTYGTAGTGTGQFSTPAGVGIDPSTGHLFVADSLNNRVVELAVTNGTVTSWVKTLTSGFSKPYGVDSDGNGHLAVADRDNNRVVILNQSDGSIAATITANDVTGGGPTTLLHPENVAFGPNTHLYIADTYHDRTLEYTLN